VGGGDISKDLFKKDIDEVLNILNQENINNNINKIEINKNAKDIIIKKKTEQSYIYFASPLNINFDSKDIYKAKVASFILGSSGFGSRLMEEIRVKNGLAYSVYAYFTHKKSHGKKYC
jgi:predicted Zn-dependent peptidase